MRILKIVLIFLGIILISSIVGVYILNQKINTSKIKSENGISSILVLGKGGIGHTAPDLTDTMMLVTINTNNKEQTSTQGDKINVISLPRDIWVESTRAKLNTSYYWGKQKGGNGLDFSSDVIKEITGIKPQYVVVVDFSMFKDVVDAVGGVDVNVENSFIDDKYPIAGKENDLCDGDKTYKCRYETLDIKAGMQHMDGDFALKFVRSRNAKGDEGTDIAREKRQQMIISAIKNRVLSVEFVTNIKAVKSLINVTLSHIETNIDKESIVSLGREIFNSRNNINYLNIPENILKVSQNNKRYDKQYVFIPSSGNWKDLQDWIAKSI